MTPTQKKYFDDMQPGQTLSASQVTDPDALIQSGKEYIDQGGQAVFNSDYTAITKLHPIPEADAIKVFISQ